MQDFVVNLNPNISLRLRSCPSTDQPNSNELQQSDLKDITAFISFLVSCLVLPIYQMTISNFIDVKIVGVKTVTLLKNINISIHHFCIFLLSAFNTLSQPWSTID